MARPKHEHPTPGELEVLKVLWRRGPSTVRQVMEALNHEAVRQGGPARAYTSVMSLLNVMTDKVLLTRKAHGRAFLYAAAAPRDVTMEGLVGDLLGRAFEGSASALVARLLDQSRPTEQELQEIGRAIQAYRERGRA